MTEDETFTSVSLVSGAIVLAAGLALVGVNSFQNRPEMVLVGFSMFSAGYKISWYGTYGFRDFRDLMDNLKRAESQLPSHIRENIDNYLLICTGLILASYGTTMFAQLVHDTSLYQALISCVLCTSGYMISHEGVNEVLI